MFTGNDPLIGNKQMNGQPFRISKRKEEDRIIPVIERQFHQFLLRYFTGYLELIFYSNKFVQDNQQSQCKDKQTR